MTAQADKNTFLRHIDPFDTARPRSELQRLRQPARARFRELDFPTPRTEDWRFTSIAALLKLPFEMPGAADPALLPPLPAADCLRLVFVNGTFAPKLSRLEGMPVWLEVGSLAQVRSDQMEGLRDVLGIADVSEHVFTALNTSFLADGAYVRLPAGKTLDTPIEVIYLSSPGRKAIVTYPRTVIFAAERSQARVVERYLGPRACETPYFTNAVTEIALGDGARVEHYKIQEEHRSAFHIANTQVALGRASTFSTTYLALGGGLVRNEVRVRFDGEGGEATVNGLYLGSGTQHLDNHTVIDHAQPHCSSHELYKGILRDQAHGVFNGKIIVREDAQKTDAKQTNKALLLSDSAIINTKPQLEIFADDVKCTHGATVGQLDTEALFYLRSRGIGVDEARALLTFAFANDVVSRIEIESIRVDLERRLTAVDRP